MNRRDLILRTIGLWVACARPSAAPWAATANENAARGSDAVPIDNDRPWAYAFWLDGNVTKEGITADLEAMRGAGIGGLLFMDGSLGMPPGPCRFMSSAWQEQFRHMVAEAHRLGLGINVNNGAGWSGSGGPWVSAEDASQVVVHSQLTLEGPSQYDAAVPLPAEIRHGHYRDIALLAYRLTGDTPGYRIKDFNSTKSFAGGMDFEDVVPWPRFIPTSPDWPELPPEEMLEESALQDLTPLLRRGRLRWQVPAGKWLILRFGHRVSNGATRMTQAEASGLEIDKLSRAAVQRHFSAFVAKLMHLGAAPGGRSLVSTHIDSWEGGVGELERWF